MIDHVTRIAVLVGYLFVCIYSFRLLVTCKCTRPRKISLWAIGTATAMWALFYAWVELSDPVAHLAPRITRIIHTVTIGAFLLQQFMIKVASERTDPTLEELLLEVLGDPTQDE